MDARVTRRLAGPAASSWASAPQRIFMKEIGAEDVSR